MKNKKNPKSKNNIDICSIENRINELKKIPNPSEEIKSIIIKVEKDFEQLQLFNNAVNLKSKIEQLTLEISLNSICEEFYNRYISDMRLHELSLLASDIVKNVSESKKNGSIIENINEESLEKYTEVSEEIGNRYVQELDRNVYIGLYQNFEMFIAELLQLLYKENPLYLKNGEKNAEMSILSIPYRDIFENNDIYKCRDQIIQKKVKDIVQSNDIVNIIEKFQRIFKINIQIGSELKNALIIMGQNRNLLVHNKGIVNQIYIDNLEKYEIEHEYNIGDSILSNLHNYLDVHSNTVYEIVQIIDGTINSQIPRFLEEKANKSKL